MRYNSRRPFQVAIFVSVLVTLSALIGLAIGMCR